MPWFKVDDKLHDHRKVRAAGAPAMGLWVLAGSWCADNLTDGFVPASVVSRWDRAAAKLASRLVEVGLWVETTVEGEAGWGFHNWESMQPTRAQVEAERAALSLKRSDAGRKGAFARWQTDGNGDGKPMANPWQTDGPDPTRPDPTPSSQSPTGDSGPAPQPVDDEIEAEASRRTNEALRQGRVNGSASAYRAAVVSDLRASGWKPPDPDFLPGTGKLNGKPDLPPENECVGPPEGLTRAGRHVHGRGGNG